MRRCREVLIRGVLAGVAVALAAAAPGPRASQEDGPVPGREVLDTAFRFASALGEADPKDMSRAQHAVVQTLMEQGDLDEALQRARTMTGWRQGVVLADLAARLARAGRGAEAAELLARAQRDGQGLEDWQKARVAAHVADGLAAVGRGEEARAMAGKVREADAAQYTGSAVATTARVHAEAGDFDGAMATLIALSDNEDFLVAWARTEGFVELARNEQFSPRQRRRALDAALTSAHGIDGWKQAEMQLQISRAAWEMADRKESHKALESAEAIILGMADSIPTKAPLLGEAARAWARLGQEARARGLLERAEKTVPEVMLIDRPGALGRVAGTYLEIGAPDQAWRLYDRAIEDAAALVNARPRVLAVVAILVYMGEAGADLDTARRARLEEIYQGLGDPW